MQPRARRLPGWRYILAARRRSAGRGDGFHRADTNVGAYRVAGAGQAQRLISMLGSDGAEVTKNRLGREIATALLLKAAALALLYFAFFDPSHRPTITPSVMTSKLFAGSDAYRE